MRTKTWAGMVVALAVLGACGMGEEAKKAEAAKARAAQWAALETQKRALDAKRAELAALQARLEQGEAGLESQLEALNRAIDAAEEQLGAQLAAYINEDPPVVGEPPTPDQLRAIRMKTSEDMVVAREYIELGGDYRKAIEIYQTALGLDPDNEELKAALAEAEARRYMTEARFAGVKKGMTQAEVRKLLGQPYHRNVKEYPDKKVTAWFYPKSDSGDAAGVWFNEKKVVYQANFNAVSAAGDKKP